MDNENRSKITQNLDFIAAFLAVSSMPLLLKLLLRESVLSQVDVEKIRNHKKDYEAVSEFANLICTKDITKFPVFIKCLNKSGNEVIAERLMRNKTGKDTSEQIWFGIRSHTRFCVGRENEMQILNKYWNDIQENNIFQTIVALTGFAGVGKTGLAKNYAKSFFESVGGHCIWIEADTPQSIQESFENLARNLKISLIDAVGKKKKFLKIVDEVFDNLFGQKTLLIFDNVDNYEEVVEPVLQLLADFSSRKPPTVLKPFVITTSRVVVPKNYLGTQFNRLELQLLTKHSATHFFHKSLIFKKPSKTNRKQEKTQKANTNNELIDKLCQRLHCYPLSMQHAAALINEILPLCDNVDEAINSYLTEFEKQSIDLLDYKLPDYEELSDTKKTIFVILKITFDKLRDNGIPKTVSTEIKGSSKYAWPQCIMVPQGIRNRFTKKHLSKHNNGKECKIFIDIINAISFLSPDEVPSPILVKILQKMGKVVDIAKIEDFFEVIGETPIFVYSREKIIFVHPIVQEVIRMELKERGEYRTLLSKVASAMYTLMDAEEIVYKDIVHCQLVGDHLINQGNMLDAHGGHFQVVCITLYNSGKYSEVLEYSCKYGDLIEFAMGPNNRHTLQIKHWKGVALRALGKYLEAAEVLQNVYDKQKTIFGVEHDDCLDTADALGVVYLGLDKYEDALNIIKPALEISERKHGKLHRRTLSLKYNIGLVLWRHGKYDDALKIIDENKRVNELLLGKEHLNTLNIKQSMASVKLELNEHQEALRMFEEVLEIRERVLEPNHPDTLNNKFLIAKTYHKMGRSDKSLQLLEDLYADAVRTFGPKHPQTIMITSQLTQMRPKSRNNGNSRVKENVKKERNLYFYFYKQLMKLTDYTLTI